MDVQRFVNGYPPLPDVHVGDPPPRTAFVNGYPVLLSPIVFTVGDTYQNVNGYPMISQYLT